MLALAHAGDRAVGGSPAHRGRVFGAAASVSDDALVGPSSGFLLTSGRRGDNSQSCNQQSQRARCAGDESNGLDQEARLF